MYLLYHNPRCSKSRACLNIIKEKKVPFKEILYIKEGLTKENLSDIINKLVSPLNSIIRTNEKEFKSNLFEYNDKNAIISFLNKNPFFLQRPLFYNETNYVICRPPEIILKNI